MNNEKYRCGGLKKRAGNGNLISPLSHPNEGILKCIIIIVSDLSPKIKNGSLLMPFELVYLIYVEFWDGTCFNWAFINL